MKLHASFINFTLTFLAAVQLIELSRVPATLAVPVKQEQMSQTFNYKQQVTLTGAPVTVSVPFPTQLEPETHFVLNVEGVEYDPKNVIPYGLYINLPPAVVPNTESPYYAGKLALFGYPQGGTFSMDITDVVSQLQNLKLITGDTVSVTFVPPKGRQKVAPQLKSKICFKRVTLTTITSSPLH